MKEKCVKGLFSYPGGIFCVGFLFISSYLFSGPGDLSGFQLLDTVLSPYPTQSVVWCGSACNYLAIVGGTVESPTTSDQVYVYEFNGLSLSFLFSQTFGQNQFFSADWCGPNCEYFATGGLQIAPVIIWNFTGTAFDQPMYPLVSLGQTEIHSVAWSCVGNPCQYLAAGGSGEYSLMVLERLQTETYSVIVAEPAERPLGIFSVAWCCDGNGNHLATGGIGNPVCGGYETVNVYDFTPGNTTLELITTQSTAGLVRSVAWCGDEASPCKYLAAGGYGIGGEQAASGASAITIFGFDGTNLNVITTQDNPSVVTSVVWYTSTWCAVLENCKYLLVTGIDKRIIAYRFDGRALCVVKFTDLPLSGLDLALCGEHNEYAAVGLNGQVAGNNTELFKLTFESCVGPIPPIPPSPPIPPLPPSLPDSPGNLQCCQKKTGFPTQATLTQCFSWDSVEGAVEYKVYQDKDLTELLAVIKSTENLCYCQCDIESRVFTTYFVVAVDSEGRQSFPASITIQS